MCCLKILCFLVIISFSSSITAIEHEIAQKWLQANQTFKNAQNTNQYLESANLYEEVIQAGVVNGYVYYNLANAYLKAQRLDYAILNYKRAARYIPEDPYLIQNFKLANSKLQQQIQFQVVKQQTAVHYLFFWHFHWKYNTRLLLFVCIYLCFWLLLIGKLVTKKIPFWNLFIPVTIVLRAIGSSIVYDILDNTKQQQAILIGKQIEIRKGDSTSYEFLYGEKKIPGGVQVRIIEKRNNWVKIQLPDGLYGWTKNNFIKNIYDRY